MNFDPTMNFEKPPAVRDTIRKKVCIFNTRKSTYGLTFRLYTKRGISEHASPAFESGTSRRVKLQNSVHECVRTYLPISR
jgi:hypothetical protein